MDKQNNAVQGAVARAGWRRAVALMTMASAASIAGCGGNDEDAAADPASAPAPSEASATIGAAGGTLNGPDGTQVVIPAQALTQDTLIRIARSSAGAPSEQPPGYLAQGTIYEVTPHDIVFERPVTMRIPVAPAAAASGAEVFASSPTVPWHPTGSVVADGFATWQSTTFSWFQPYPCAPRLGDPFPCAWVRLTTLADTATTGALTITSIDPLRSRTYALTQAATVQMTLRYQAAQDCGDPRLSVTRVDRRNNVIGAPLRLIDNLSVGLAPKPGSTSVSEGSHTFAVAFTDADNGTVSFASVVSCQRLFQTPGPVHRQTDRDAVVFVVNAAAAATAPPVITQQPANAVVNVGASAAFALAATAPDSLTLDWQRSNDAGVTWSSLAFSGTGYAFVAAAVDTGARFRARVCNVKGNLPPNCIFTAAAVLTVNVPLPAPAPTGQKLAAGNQHTCAIRADGSLACWGYNSSGQIGVGNRTSFVQPTVVSLPEATIAVATGYDSSCALGASRTLRCWGDAFASTTPVVIGGINGVDVGGGGIKEVTVGRGHACVLTLAGNVWCRGSNSVGQLGNGTTTYSDALVLVQGAGGLLLTSVTGLSANEFRTCATRSNGSVMCWGQDAPSPSLIAVEVGDITSAIQVSGDCAVLGVDATVLCWTGIAGANPLPVAGLANVARIGFGAPNCALINGGTVQCWGSGLFGNGQLFETRAAPSLVSGLNGVGAIAAGGSHTCVLRSDATLRCWGSGQFGQLGVGDTGGRTTPTLVPDAIGWATP